MSRQEICLKCKKPVLASHLFRIVGQDGCATGVEHLNCDSPEKLDPLPPASKGHTGPG